MTGKWVACSEQESFDVDQKRLEQKYKKLQTVYHPDRYANTSRVHITLEFLSCPLASRAQATQYVQGSWTVLRILLMHPLAA